MTLIFPLIHSFKSALNTDIVFWLLNSSGSMLNSLIPLYRKLSLVMFREAATGMRAAVVLVVLLREALVINHKV